MSETITETPVSETILMVRAAAAAKGGPTTADVHPNEINEYRSAGWTVAPPPAPEDPQGNSNDSSNAGANAQRDGVIIGDAAKAKANGNGAKKDVARQ